LLASTAPDARTIAVSNPPECSATNRRASRLSVLTRSPGRDGNQAGATTALPILAGTGWCPGPRAQLTLHGGVIEGQRDSRNEERATPTRSYPDTDARWPLGRSQTWTARADRRVQVIWLASSRA
jgi:hypothetical protein